MFIPKYNLSPYFLSLFEQIISLKSVIDNSKISFTAALRLQQDALAKNTHASTSIEGNQIPLYQVEALAEHKQISAEQKQQIEVENYFAALKWIMKNQNNFASEENLLRIHKLLMKELTIKEKTGKYRLTQNYVINEKKIVEYTPPAPGKIKLMMQDLIKWLNNQEKLNPIIVSAIFHHQFVTIHPFLDGNGRTARLVAQWLLYQNGFDTKHFLAIDEYFAKDRKKYYQKITQTRELDYDFTYWIEYVAEAVLFALQRVHKKIAELGVAVSYELILTPKQEALINLIVAKGILSSAEIQKELDINRARVNILLQPLLKAGILKSSGKARAVRYSLLKQNQFQ